MAFTKTDVANKQVNGGLVELSDAEKQAIVDEWNAPQVDNRTYAEKRKAEYPSLDELIVALWEGVVEERMASVTALEGLRQAVKDKYPKPE
ncbi:MAG: hypothetical protein QF535_10770 [Anaerolineales bacterium]|nr:hypothetical protein [Anaerolineales bacterium]